MYFYIKKKVCRETALRHVGSGLKHPVCICIASLFSQARRSRVPLSSNIHTGWEPRSNGPCRTASACGGCVVSTYRLELCKGAMMFTRQRSRLRSAQNVSLSLSSTCLYPKPRSPSLAAPSTLRTVCQALFWVWRASPRTSRISALPDLVSSKNAKGNRVNNIITKFNIQCASNGCLIDERRAGQGNRDGGPAF